MNDEVLGKVVSELHRSDVEQRKHIKAIEKYLVMQAELAWGAR